jgi:hypothetical protein
LWLRSLEILLSPSLCPTMTATAALLSIAILFCIPFFPQNILMWYYIVGCELLCKVAFELFLWPFMLSSFHTFSNDGTFSFLFFLNNANNGKFNMLFFHIMSCIGFTSLPVLCVCSDMVAKNDAALVNVKFLLLLFAFMRNRSMHRKASAKKVSPSHRLIIQKFFLGKVKLFAHKKKKLPMSRLCGLAGFLVNGKVLRFVFHRSEKGIKFDYCFISKSFAGVYTRQFSKENLHPPAS